ncbi:MAG: epoxyqueuosine reductase QueH [Lachnospiraceae bacterium]|nr:epoxyqueuosine reductase QueH [Lachnospiraceae bacterium]
MNQRNYQKELDAILEKLSQGGTEKVPTLFLHSCCGPCSSYVLEYLAPFFQITVFYYNPNISMEAEYQHRVAEQKRLIECYNQEKKGHMIEVLEGDYRPSDFYEIAKGYEDCKEGGERCFRCYELRLRETALQAAKRGMDYFATTLTISPLKNAIKLNEIGEALSEELRGRAAAGEKTPIWLPSDFKKKGGYQRSIELSKEYHLYRQDYCGCSFSKAERKLSSSK